MGGQALNASRTPAFTYKPQDLFMQTDPKGPFYSETVNDPITDMEVLDIATRGVLTSLLVRRTDTGDVVIEGRNRVKKALVINHLTGVCPYTGSLASVRDAILRLSDSDIGRRVVELALKWGETGVMVRAFSANAGSDADAEATGLAADEMRRGGSGLPWDVRARRARQLVEAGQPIATVAASMKDVSPETLKRWLAKLDAGETPKERKVTARGASSRPKTRHIKLIFKKANDVKAFTDRERMLLAFVLGETTEGMLFQMFPQLTGGEEA